MKIVPLEIEGLDLVLGGGIALVERAPGAGESAVLALRGPPGSGKTILGAQIAGAIAAARKCDIAYGCVEILPVELEAQLANFDMRGVSMPPLVPPFLSPSSVGQPRFCAAALGLQGSKEDSGRLIEPAARALLDEVTSAGGHPGVLVIDSLSDGYGLGSSIDRVYADALCSLAKERGVVLILLEETAHARPSAWAFASDVVIELSPLNHVYLLGRALRILKNRFGPSDPGPHVAGNVREGTRVYPRPGAYLTRTKPDTLRNLPAWTGGSQDWDVAPGVTLPDFRDCVTAVFGVQGRRVRQLAFRLGAKGLGGQETLGQDLVVEFNGPDGFALTPFINGHWFLGIVFEKLSRVREPLRRVLIGDLRSLRAFHDPVGLRQSIAILTNVLRAKGVPVVLFETLSDRALAPSEMNPSSTMEAAANDEPPSTDIADVIIELRREPGPPAGQAEYVTNLRTGVQTKKWVHFHN